MLSETNTIVRFSGFDPRDIDTSRVWRSSVAICLVVLIVGSSGPVASSFPARAKPLHRWHSQCAKTDIYHFINKDDVSSGAAFWCRPYSLCGARSQRATEDGS